MKLSENQENVINLVEGDLLVSASAGSGKTAVLVERILNLILNYGVSIDEILVITFTNAAATEMGERILQALESRITDDNKEKIEEQIFLIQNSNIQTFHAFCLEIINNNYYKLNLSSGIKILKEGHRKILINEVIEETFNYYYENKDENFLDLVNKYGGKYSDLKLREIIILIYNFIETMPNPHEFKEKILKSYDIESYDDILTSPWGENLKLFYIEKVKNFIEYGKEFSLGMSEDDKAYEMIVDDILIGEKFINNINSSYLNCYNFLQDMKFKRFPSKLSEDFDSYKLKRDKFKKLMDSLRKEIFLNTYDEIKNYIKDLYNTVNSLLNVVDEFSKNFREKKKSGNLIDFNDMEHLTLNLLKDEGIRENLKQKFKYIFIDEYQDTNYVQEFLINSIKREDPFNVFMVGDVKQSIYSFRGAKVSLFHNKYNSFNKVDSLLNLKGYSNKILLYDNYRSRREIIDFINFIFKNIMVKPISNIEYTEEEYLNYMGSYETYDNEDKCSLGEINLSVVIEEDGEDTEDNESLGEIKLIIDYIKSLVDESRKAQEIFDKSTNSYRKIDYRDIVILMRNVKSSSKSSLLEEEMIKNNIPVYFDGGSTFFDSIEVIVFISLLKIIDNPLDDVDLLTLLRSEIFNFKENELAYLRIVNNDDYLYNNIKFISEMNLNNETNVYLNEEFSIDSKEFNTLYLKCKKFISDINLYREKSNIMRLDDFIWYLYMNTNYYFLVSTLEDGIKAQNNLKLIFNKGREFREGSFSGLFNFIEYLKNSKASGDDTLVPKNISENENVVRIMSIHKSKGLEFPVVILCNTSSSFNTKSLNHTIVLDDDFGIGINYIDYKNNLEIESIIKTSIKNKMKRSIVSEELRILYVALTRAKEKLFIVGSYKSDKSFKNIYDLDKCKSYLDFLCNALMSYKDGGYFRDKTEYFDKLISNEDLSLKINIINQKDLEESKENHKVLDIYSFKEDLENGENDKESISKILNYEYEFNEFINTPINLSVSEIFSYDKEDDETIIFNTPKFLNKENKKIYSGIDIGNLYHMFMQNINLKSNIDFNYIEEELNFMVSSNIFDVEDKNHIDVNKVLKFFQNDLGKRVLNSFDLNSKNVYREFEFLMKHRVNKVCEHEDIRIQGIVDLFFFEKDYIILIDYKTDKMIFRNNERFLKKYREQLYYYELALQKIFNKEVKEKYIYYFELGKEIIL